MDPQFIHRHLFRVIAYLTGVRNKVCFFFCFSVNLAFAQQPTADFSLPGSGCLNQNIFFKNLSTNASSYQWDFCQGDLSLSPSALTVGPLGGSVTTGIDLVSDGTNWFGFVTSQSTNSVLRLDFGTDIRTTPTIVNLGNVSGHLNSPTDIKIVCDNGNWYGFVYCLSGSLISRINFGNSITSTTGSPTPVTADIVMSGAGSVNGGFDMMYDGTNWIVVLTFNSSFQLVRLTSVNSIPAGADVKPVTNALGNSLGDLALVKSAGNYFGYVADFGNKTLQRLSFGTSLFSTPSVSYISPVVSLGSLIPYGVDIANDNGNYYLFVCTLQGNLLQVTLGSDLTSAPVAGADLGTMGTLSNTLKVRAKKAGSKWSLFSDSWASNQLFRVDFPQPSSCPANIQTSTLANPSLYFTTSGKQYVGLQALSGGSVNEINKAITISSSIAPDIDYNATGSCVNNNTSFTATNLSGNVSLYTWDFGDTNTFAAASPSATNVYASTGDFNVDLTVSATNGCQNEMIKVISIYNAPTTDFTVPTPSVSCSNQDYTFTNTSSFDSGSNPSWQWTVDGNPVSTAKDLIYSFPAIGSPTINLIASIPGCSSQTSKGFSVVQQGPLPDFTLSGNCQGSPTIFTNQTVGTVTSYLWDFGDTRTSSSADTQNTYAMTGTYNISLTASNASGCNNSISKALTIYAKPAVDFAVALPPFSCSGSPSSFNDFTPPLSDSNLAFWQWDFGDPASGQNTSSVQKPFHTYTNAGVYNVTLIVTSDANCSATLQKPVNILQSPTASFINTPACKDQSTYFTNTSADATAWTWQIQTTLSSLPNPTHIFTASGDYPVFLTVEASNGCFASISKTITVPVPLTPDFSVQKSCVLQKTVFMDVTNSSDDAVAKDDWDFSIGTGTGSPTTFSFPTKNNYSVKLKVTGQSGCSYGVTKNINIVDSPVASFTASPNSGAPPLLVQFNNLSTLATNYLWTFYDTNTSTSTLTSPVYTFKDFGDYIVDLTASNAQGCSNTVSKVITALLPANDVSITALSTIKNTDGSITMIATIRNNGNTPLSDFPIFMDLSGRATIRENIASSIAPKQTYNHLFSYSITSINQLDYLCVEVDLANDTNPADNRLCTSLSQKPFLYDPYPNPAKTEVNIDLIANADDNASVVIWDALGKQALQTIFIVKEGLNHFTLPTDNLSTGVYIISIQTSSEKKVRQIAISR